MRGTGACNISIPTLPEWYLKLKLFTSQWHSAKITNAFVIWVLLYYEVEPPHTITINGHTVHN